jgi:hypothetical protein
MKTYTVTVTYEKGILASAEVPAPDRDVLPGDTYEFIHAAYTLAGVDYEAGDHLEILDQTAKAPHYRTSSQGNLVVRCKHFTSVWTNIPWMVADGRLKLVSTKAEGPVVSLPPSR